MHNTLKEIIKQKRIDVKQPKQQRFLSLFKKKQMVIIGEVKLASPSVGVLAPADVFIPKVHEYRNAGIDAISVITEKHFFHGDSAYIKQVTEAVSLPVLQKDFVIDEQQIYEAKALGADALLLIARILTTQKLSKFVEHCLALDIEPVVEIHSVSDLRKAVKTHTRIIAVNARNLETFYVDVENACRLIKKIPVGYVKLGFSGITSRKEVALYKDAGVDGILIGTALTKEVNVDAFLSSLR